MVKYASLVLGVSLILLFLALGPLKTLPAFMQADVTLLAVIGVIGALLSCCTLLTALFS